MVVLGAFTARGRAKGVPGALAPLMLALGAAAIVTLGMVLALGVFEPEPRYLVPVGGMVIGNAMTAAAVALNRLGDEVRTHARPDRGHARARRDLAARRVRGLVTRSLRSGMIPLIDQTKTTGVIAFPGIMVGMLLAGAEPLDAVRLQLDPAVGASGKRGGGGADRRLARLPGVFYASPPAQGVSGLRPGTASDMKAVTWHGKRDVRVDSVPDPSIEQPTDAIVRITSTCICGSDLHLYEVLGAFIDEGDILGHEPMGIVEEVGSEVRNITPGDRVVIPFNISCGSCWMCDQKLFSQCETTQVRDQDKGAALLGYTKLYGQVPGGQAELLRVPQAHFGPIKVPEGPPDERFVFLSDVLPTAWQAVEYAAVPEGGSVAVFGLGPIGQMCCRIARHRGASLVIGVDLVPERLEMARRHGAQALDRSDVGDIAEAIQELTDGRGTDSVIDAVGMEAHGAPLAKLAQDAAGLVPDAVARPMIERAGIDRLSALYDCFDAVRRGGTVSISGVYGGAKDPMPMMQLFDKQLQLRMGQANVRAGSTT